MRRFFSLASIVIGAIMTILCVLAMAGIVVAMIWIGSTWLLESLIKTCFVLAIVGLSLAILGIATTESTKR